eukprot:jgi/Ulvmu1/10995/UM007_0175.1
MDAVTGTTQLVHSNGLKTTAAQCEAMALSSTVPGSSIYPDAPLAARQDSDAAVQSSTLPDALRGQIRLLCGGPDQPEATTAQAVDSSLQPGTDSVRHDDSQTGSGATGVVLAVKQCGEESAGDSSGGVEGMRSMLAVFGLIENYKQLTPPQGSPGIRLAVFKYASPLDAQHAVAAIGSSARTSFSLHLLNHRGDIMPASPARAMAPPMRPADIGAAASDAITRRSSSASTPTNNTDSTSASTSMALNYDYLHEAHLAQHGGAAAVPPPRSSAFSGPAPPPLEQQLSGMSGGSAGGGMVQAFPQHGAQHGAAPVSSSPFDPANLQYLLAAGPFSSQTRAGLLGLLSQPPGGGGGGSSMGGPAGVPGPRPAQSPSPPAGNADYLTAFDPNEAARDGLTARTTIMIRNIPCRWTAQDLLSVLSTVIGDTWDLLYMPCKNSDVAHAGYAFMNFKTASDTLNLYAAMHGRSWPNTRSSKICEIRYARIQGRHLLSHLFASDSQGAPSAAFRGYLAFPAHGSVVVHGPEAGAARTQGKRGRGGGRKGGGRRAAALPMPVPHPADILGSGLAGRGGQGMSHGPPQWMLPQGMHGGQPWPAAPGPGRLPRGMPGGMQGLGMGDAGAMAAVLAGQNSFYPHGGAHSLHSEPSYHAEDSGQAFHLHSMLSALTQSMDQQQMPDMPVNIS